MKYQKKKFTLDPQNDAFRDNWDSVFADEEPTITDPPTDEELFAARLKEKAETPVKESRPSCRGCSDCAMGNVCYPHWAGQNPP